MKKRVLDLQDEKPLLDIAGYARSGRMPTPAQRLHIQLTVHRAPEVMVKVSGGSRTLSGVERHMAYIGREGELGLEADVGGHLGGKGFERSLVREWNLDSAALANHTIRSSSPRKPPKLVHNIIFSMPPGTSPKAVLKAVQKLALNEWALQHRYAMALHTDDDHPHVHVVLKAVSERGVRLNIRKATLRSWRAQFASNLRELGVNANATERAVRGRMRDRKPDGVYRGEIRDQARRELYSPEGARLKNTRWEAQSAGLLQAASTQQAVRDGWRQISTILIKSGDRGLSDQVSSFEAQMSDPFSRDRMVRRSSSDPHKRIRHQIASEDRDRSP